MNRIESTVFKLIKENFSDKNLSILELCPGEGELSKALLEYETLNGEDVDALLRGEAILRPEEGQDTPPSATPSSTVPASGKVRGEEGPSGLDPEPQPET